MDVLVRFAMNSMMNNVDLRWGVKKFSILFMKASRTVKGKVRNSRIQLMVCWSGVITEYN